MADSFVDPDLSNPKRPWNEYFEAKVGFRNYWYPACFSSEIQDGEVVIRKILGEGILLRRVRGKVRAIRDRCIHRGAKFSDKVECYTPDTITCFYHGFTFNWEDGKVETVFGAPTSAVIGSQRRIQTYPVEEANGLVFVFVGDPDYKVPPLAHDVPPGFLDPGISQEGVDIVVKANWRTGPEGGLDEIHRYLHRDSPLLLYAKKSIPLGHAGAAGQMELIEGEAGPKGIIDRFKPDRMFWDGVIKGEVVVSGVNFGPQPDTGKHKRTLYTSVWLPACLKVVSFPDDGFTLFEWYVPIDENTHRCFMTFIAECGTEAEVQKFREDFKLRWKPLAVDGFLMQDAMARESIHEFYRHDRAWLQECLVEDDVMIMEWRRLCSRNSRGVQRPSHVV